MLCVGRRSVSPRWKEARAWRRRRRQAQALWLRVWRKCWVCGLQPGRGFWERWRKDRPRGGAGPGSAERRGLEQGLGEVLGGGVFLPAGVGGRVAVLVREEALPSLLPEVCILCPIKS